jgi:hypothetical protein
MRDARRLFRVEPRDGSDAAPRIVPESWDVNLTSKAKSDDADVERSRHARKAFAIAISANSRCRSAACPF